eukprot:2042276-Rhodomonas_salina.1
MRTARRTVQLLYRGLGVCCTEVGCGVGGTEVECVAALLVPNNTYCTALPKVGVPVLALFARFLLGSGLFVPVLFFLGSELFCGVRLKPSGDTRL